MGCRPPLSIVIGAIIAVFVLIVGAAGIFTTNFSLTALDTVSRPFATAQSAIAREFGEAYFNGTTHALEALANSTAVLEGFMLPSDESPTTLAASGELWSAKWFRVVSTADGMVATGRSFSATGQPILSVLKDETFIMCGDYGNFNSAANERVLHHVPWLTPRIGDRVSLCAATSPSFLATGGSTVKRLDFLAYNHTSRDTATTSTLVTEDRVQVREMNSTSSEIYAAAKTTTSNGVSRKVHALPLQLLQGSVVFPFIISVWNSTLHLGYAAIWASLFDLNYLLPPSQFLDGTMGFMIDQNTKLILATSHSASYYYELPNAPSAPLGCELNPTNPSSNTLHCRYHVNDHPFGPLRDLAQGYGDSFDSDFALENFDSDGTEWIATVERLHSNAVGFRVAVYLFTPRSEFDGSVREARIIAACVSLALLLLASVIGFLFVRKLLAPVGEIAAEIRTAATFGSSRTVRRHRNVYDDEDDDDADEMDDLYEMNNAAPNSRLEEVAGLQHAFYSMQRKLLALRSYIPPAVLAAIDDHEGSVGGAHHAKDGKRNAHDDEELMLVEEQERLERELRTSKVLQQQQQGTGSEYIHLDTSRSHANSVLVGRGDTNADAAFGGSRLTGFGPQLNTQTWLAKERITVLTINFCQFHDFLQSHAAEHIEAAQKMIQRAVSSLERTVKHLRGVVDFFQGDHFYITFNAARPVRVSSLRAALTALRCSDELPNILRTPTDATLHMTSGIATGMAYVGNFGSSTMKRFTSIGPVFTQSSVLERLCKLYSGVCCLIPSAIFFEVEPSVTAVPVDIVMLPFSSKRIAIAEVRPSDRSHYPVTNASGDLPNHRMSNGTTLWPPHQDPMISSNNFDGQNDAPGQAESAHHQILTAYILAQTDVEKAETLLEGIQAGDAEEVRCLDRLRARIAAYRGGGPLANPLTDFYRRVVVSRNDNEFAERADGTSAMGFSAREGDISIHLGNDSNGDSVVSDNLARISIHETPATVTLPPEEDTSSSLGERKSRDTCESPSIGHPFVPGADQDEEEEQHRGDDPSLQ